MKKILRSKYLFVITQLLKYDIRLFDDLNHSPIQVFVVKLS